MIEELFIEEHLKKLLEIFVNGLLGGLL